MSETIARVHDQWQQKKQEEKQKQRIRQQKLEQERMRKERQKRKQEQRKRARRARIRRAKQKQKRDEKNRRLAIEEKCGRAVSYTHLEVETRVLKEECDALNPVFFHYITSKTPYVVMKYAMTMDGKIACDSGESKWVTGEMARAYGR